jgi:hypothetical protein
MEYYQDIATVLNESCPHGYSKAWISAEVGDDWDDQEVWCENGNQKSQPDIEASKQFNIGRNLRKIRAQMTIPGEKPWSRCTFILFPDGKFKFDVEYDD